MQQIPKEPFLSCPERKAARREPSYRCAAVTKTLFLSMPRADADALILNYRIALEAAKSGHADAVLIRRLFTMALLTRFLTEAGHGLLERVAPEEGESVLVEIAGRGPETGDWTRSRLAIELLVCITNEHDRQLQQTRVEVLIDASNRLDRFLDRQRLSPS
ncbi:hypothetical protein [Paraburkholderia sp. RL17-347-BIC-D]|uniref:hypothetical protein n=1 Tax=Paraburkholderia sp. RL17-347-BIC-D TaxID=3031632 RepID=UPI0038B7E65C